MEQTLKQQAVERIKSANNVLVTVSKNPTIDQLAACIGFTLLLNKLGKHATAVFSGAVPSTLEFLQPEKTIEQNTDSLRDFIIALDKSKADKLRYKVEDEVVRIFITPYRTSISEKDLDFSQGDFNVDVVVALGVTNKEDIDQAIVAHGRILHDATVISVTNGQTVSDVGSVNWHDETASSLCEMLVSITESFQSGLLDGQMATAFLTGIVAETERFSNGKTSPKVMTMSAQLMAAGANQQLIATQLTPPEPEPQPEPELPVQQAEPYMPPSEQSTNEQPEAEEKPKNDGEIEIEHQDDAEIHIDDEGNLKRQEELRQAEENRKRLEEESVNSSEEDSEEPVSTQADSYIAGSSHKVVQPLNNVVSDPLAAFAPQTTQPQPDQMPMQSMQLPPVEAAPIVTPVAEQAPLESAPVIPEPVASAPSLPTTDSVVPQVETQSHTVTQPEPSWSLPANYAAPQPDQAPANDSLASLEQAVDSPHLDQARAAVQSAALDSVPRPEPSQSVGAQFIDMGNTNSSLPQPQAPQQGMPGIADVLHQTSTNDDAQVIMPTDPMAPPPVPPPMMPQYFGSNDSSQQGTPPLPQP